jgi:hypothetical protein
MEMKEYLVLAAPYLGLGLGIIGLVVAFLWAWNFDASKDTANSFARRFLEAKPWQKWFFFAYTVVGPLLLLGAWHLYGKDLTGTELTKYQHEEKLVSDLWSAGAVFFGVFWGLKKLK